MAKRTGSKKKKRNWTLPQFSLPERATLWRAGVAAAWLLLFATIIGAWSYGVPELKAYASERAAHDVPAAKVEVEFIDAPAWVAGELQARLEMDVRTALNGTEPFRQDDLIGVYNTLVHTGWFESIEQVRRRRVDLIEVTGVFVDPYAVVRQPDGDYLIDPYGYLLPRRFPAGTVDRFVVILGVRFPPPGRAGVQWEGADLIAALRLNQLIDEQPWRSQVTAINVTDHLQGRPMRLITDEGTRITWGSAPGEESGLEATVDRKLAYLNNFYHNYGHINGGYRDDLDITSHHEVVITRRENRD